MKKLIFTKFLIDITKSFFLISICFSIIVWAIQSVNYLELITEDGHGFKVYFLYTLLNFPKIFTKLLPFVFFISLFSKIIEYEMQNELIIFWSNGISKIEFINVLIIFSFLFLIFQLFFGSYLSPLSQYKARTLLKNSNIDFFPSLIKEGKFIDAITGLTIFIDQKIDYGNYANIFLTEEKNDGIKRIIYAKNGSLINETKKKVFKLKNGKIINKKKKKSVQFEFDELNIDLSQYGSKTITRPKIQEINSFKLLKCIIYNYKNKIQEFKDDDFICRLSTLDVMKQELLRRFHLPLYLPLISLLCGILVFKSKEYIYYNKFKYNLFALTFFIIVFSEISLRYALINFFSFIFFITFPIIVFFTLYIISKYKKHI